MTREELFKCPSVSNMTPSELEGYIKELEIYESLPRIQQGDILTNEKGESVLISTLEEDGLNFQITHGWRDVTAFIRWPTNMELDSRPSIRDNTIKITRVKL